MTPEQIQQQIEAIRKVSTEACETPGKARKLLRDAEIIEPDNIVFQANNDSRLRRAWMMDSVYFGNHFNPPCLWKDIIAKWIITPKIK